MVLLVVIDELMWYAEGTLLTIGGYRLAVPIIADHLEGSAVIHSTLRRGSGWDHHYILSNHNKSYKKFYQV